MHYRVRVGCIYVHLTHIGEQRKMNASSALSPGFFGWTAEISDEQSGNRSLVFSARSISISETLKSS